MTKRDFGFVNPKDIPHSPTGRIPKWVTDEALGKRVDPEPWRAPATGSMLSSRRQQRRRRNQRAIPVLVILTLVLVSIVSRTNSQVNPSGYRSNNAISVSPVVPQVRNGPTPGREEATNPLAAPITVVPTSNSYKFLDYQADNTTPVDIPSLVQSSPFPFSTYGRLHCHGDYHAKLLSKNSLRGDVACDIV